MVPFVSSNRYLRAGLQIGAAVACGLLLTGCFFRGVFGHVIYLTDEDDHLTQVLAQTGVGSTVSVCSVDINGLRLCTYVIDGEIVTPTLFVSSELLLVGLLIDPLIAQVPADVSTITATYDVGGGPQPLIVSAVTSFKVTTGLTATAEAGHKFIILELPPAVEAALPPGDPEFGLPISYTLAYERLLPASPPLGPQTVKLMLAGRVDLYGQKYYLPLLPCVTDFAQVPALPLPEAATPQDLSPALGSLLAANPDAACDDQLYFFPHVPPPAFKYYLPLLRR